MRPRSPVRTALVTLTMLGASASLAGCGASGGADSATTEPASISTDASTAASTTVEMEGRGDIIEDEPASGPTEDFVTVSDPVNDAFSVGVPNGWDSLVYSSVEGQVTHEVVNTVSPDGKTILFIGDPKIPSYWNPATADPITVSFTEKLDFMELRSYVPATEYMPDYVAQKFGELPGFELTETIEDVDAGQRLTQAFIDRGLTPPNVQIADVHFTYQDDDGEQVNALIVGTTADSGDFWWASVLGLSTTASTDEYRPMLAAMTKTQQSNPAWTAQQDARHQQVLADIDRRTAEMTSQHQANMAAIQSSAARHQQKMEGLWAANDASVAGFYDRMASGDATQRGFLNYINDENTVATSTGTQFQVDDSYDRYWLNPSTGSYVGGDVNFGDSALRELGLNPSDYEEVQVVR